MGKSLSLPMMIPTLGEGLVGTCREGRQSTYPLCLWGIWTTTSFGCLRGASSLLTASSPSTASDLHARSWYSQNCVSSCKYSTPSSDKYDDLLCSQAHRCRVDYTIESHHQAVIQSTARTGRISSNALAGVKPVTVM